jgi:lipoyl(octanoyl) transferase
MYQSPKLPIELMRSTSPVDYSFAEKTMISIVDNIYNKHTISTIWVLEHPSIYTMGTSAHINEIKKPSLPIYQTGRGGKITYHGPGQRIYYIMLDLKTLYNQNPDIKDFIKRLLNSISTLFHTLGVSTYLDSEQVGIWCPGSPPKKLVALGIRLRKWITYHGFAINLNPDLQYYDDIIPCGITDKGVTSLAQQGVNLSASELDKMVIQSICKEFEMEIIQGHENY